MAYIRKRTWPLRRVLDRRQDFHCTEDYPDGFIEERLECGHVYLDNIARHTETHRSNVERRRCEKCARAARSETGAKP